LNIAGETMTVVGFVSVWGFNIAMRAAAMVLGQILRYHENDPRSIQWADH
jgi:hypothetical protein